MPKFNIISAKKMIKILGFLGFVSIRSKGSHQFFFNETSGKSATVPVHGNSDLGVGIIREILRDIDLSVVEYEKLRRKV